MPDAAQRHRWTYGQLLEQSEQAARALAARFTPGERVAVWAPNIPECVILEFGAALARVGPGDGQPRQPAGRVGVRPQPVGSGGDIPGAEVCSPMTQLLDEIRPEVRGLREKVLFTEWDEFLASADAGTPLPDDRLGQDPEVQTTGELRRRATRAGRVTTGSRARGRPSRSPGFSARTASEGCCVPLPGRESRSKPGRV
ncbi:MAG: AMP-binding protein [Acidimicrobiales bacterium]